MEELKELIAEIASLLEKNDEPNPQLYTPFLQNPELVLLVIELINALPDEDTEQARVYYSACIFAVDLSVAQLQGAHENANKYASKILQQLMLSLATMISKGKHHLSFWLPVLNAFYEVHVELSIELKNAYLELAGQEEDNLPLENDGDQVGSILEMIAELGGLSPFDIAENFFAQSYAMPADFFFDLIVDLYSVEEGHDIALLTLLHPKEEVREIVIATFEQMIKNIRLSSISLSRLQAIKHWYPVRYHDQFERWIKIQRMKGVVFATIEATPILGIQASEVDGGGAQGVFIHLKNKRKNRLCGLLFRQEFGIKDAWSTPDISAKEVVKYYDEAFEGNLSLRKIDLVYLVMMTNHFLALTINQEKMPDLHLLEIQELLGVHFQPQLLDLPYLIEQLSVQIIPFTSEAMQASFKRSKAWPRTKQFTESWFIENSEVDKIVNRSSTIVEGVKICAIKKATVALFEKALEPNRDKWLFHFLWVALWAKSQPLKTEKLWQDSFFIAYAIHQGTSLAEIPLMHEICEQTVINSIETMNERRTYLSKE